MVRQKKTLVLVPGLLCTGRMWREQIEALKDDFDILVADVSSDDSISGIAERILEDAPERFHLAGLSMGGYVALEVAVRGMERLERLALLDTSARADTPEQTKLRLALISRAKREGLTPVAHELFPRLVHESRTNDTELADTVVAMAEETGVEVFERQEQAIIARSDNRGELPRITCPTLVVCGREDVITPLTVNREMADTIPDARLHTVEGCGHLSTLEKPDEVSGVLRDFLTL